MRIVLQTFIKVLTKQIYFLCKCYPKVIAVFSEDIYSLEFPHKSPGESSWRDLPIWSTTPYMKYYSLYGVLKQIQYSIYGVLKIQLLENTPQTHNIKCAQVQTSNLTIKLKDFATTVDLEIFYYSIQGVVLSIGSSRSTPYREFSLTDMIKQYITIKLLLMTRLC